jgi:hypothetical protein
MVTEIPAEGVCRSRSCQRHHIATIAATEFAEKLKSFSERSVVTRQFMRQLGQAKDFPEVLRLHAEFIQNQMKTFAEQATSLAEAYSKTTASKVKIPFKSSLD